MTFTVGGNVASNLSQIATPEPVLGIAVVFLILFAFMKLASWGDRVNGRSSNEKGTSSIIIIFVVVIVLVSVIYCGQSTGHTELITSSQTSIQKGWWY